MGILNTLKFVSNHPLNRKSWLKGIDHFVFWQILTRFNRYPILYNLINDHYIIAQKGLTGVTGNIYCGLHEFEDMAFVLHYLRPGDLFADIGANVGSYTILAGATGSSVSSVEPLPATFHYLERNIGVNRFDGHVQALNIGLSSEPGSLFFTNYLDTINHVVPAGTPNSQEVPVSTLDLTFGNRNPCLIKMDVEGFEAEVLKGGTKTLASQDLDALIIELSDASVQYGITQTALVQQLTDLGFHRMNYEPFVRSLLPYDPGRGGLNGLFVKNVDRVRERLKNSARYKIRNTYL